MSIDKVFADLGEFEKSKLAGLKDRALLLGMSTLFLAAKAGERRMTARQISDALIAAGVYLTATSVTNAFKRARRRVAPIRENGVTYYALMTSGREEVSSIFMEEGVMVLAVSAGHPFSNRLSLEKMQSGFSDEVLVFDTYYGTSTLDALRLVPSKCEVKFLTVNPDSSKKKFDGLVADFKAEFPHIELKTLGGQKGYHDRYIVSDSHLLILGQGMKDFGKAESFAVLIPRELGEDLISEKRATFMRRWDAAVPQ